MALVFGIGSGLFTLCFVWFVGLAACLFLSRSGKGVGVFGIVLLLVLFTVTLVLFPRKGVNEEDVIPKSENLDTITIPRVVYAIFIILFVLIAMVAYFLDHVLMQNVAMAVKNKKTFTF